MAEDIKEEVKDENVKTNEDTSKENEEVESNESLDETSNKKEKKNKYKDQISKLEASNKKLEADYKDLKNEYLKVYAEMENTKRRLKEDAIKDRKYASQKVVGELVTPIDMLLQIVNLEVTNEEVKNYQIGFKMIANQLVDILKGEGLAPIEVKKEFDPKVMQAVETESHEDLDDNQVIRVSQPGYMFKDRVLRPAMVVVNKKEVKENKEEKKEEE